MKPQSSRSWRAWRRMVLTVLFALVVAVCAYSLTSRQTPSLSAAADGSFDQYGGIPVRVARPDSTFRRVRIGTRWVLVTPEGNAFWMLGVYNVDWSPHVDDLGSSYQKRAIVKYGDVDRRWGPQQARRLKAWGFNTLAGYANKWTLPDTTPQSLKIPWVGFVWPAFYSLRNVNNLAPGPVKEIIRPTDEHYKEYRGHFPDVFDPNFALWLRGSLYGASPWMVGMSVDDADWLTGLGAGPDFDSGGHTNPHLGFVALITPPSQTENKEFGVKFADTKVYTKYALQAFLQARYKTISALNNAWKSAYSTWDSDGGWPSGRGLLDENGKGAWVGTDGLRLSNATPVVRTDLDDFLSEIAEKYFATVQAEVRARLPNTLYLGPTNVGSWGAPARRQVLKAAGRHVDVLRISWSGQQDRLNFVAQHAGDVPLAIWLGAFANPDSALYRYHNPWFSSQAERGNYYRQMLAKLFESSATATGVHPFVGLEWWEFHDNWAEKSNWGLVTLSDNAYDGKEAVRAKGKDQWGFATGGEERDYGDFISHVREANFGTLERLREELLQQQRSGELNRRHANTRQVPPGSPR